LVALTALVLITAACGSTGTGSPPSPTVDITPAATPTKAPLVFPLNGLGTTAKGTITVTTGPDTLTVELKIAGLLPKSSHVNHIHIGTCAARGGIKYALNQVTADGQGDADIKTTVKATYPPTSGKWYVVVHAGPDMNGTNSKYLLCGNLLK
jgi:Cu/Zn superoxide dismutase